MNVVILYDSWYGNTEAIARLVASTLGEGAQLCKVAYATHLDFDDIDLLVIGSPTHGGVATPAMNEYLAGLPEDAFSGIDVAVFDTRVGKRWVKLIGFAAKRLARQVELKGGKLIAEPVGFYVDGTQGPLRSGESERACLWAASLAESMSTKDAGVAAQSV